MRHAKKIYAALILISLIFICFPFAYSAMIGGAYQAAAITGTSGKMVGLSSASYTAQSIAGQPAIGTVTYNGATAQNSHFGFLYLLSNILPQIKKDYEIYDVQAFSHSTSEQISATTWQLKNDPYFVWKINLPNNPAEILGYSVAMDAEPDETIDITQTFYDQFYTNPLSDGKHKFYVMAAIAGGTWSPSSSFEIWIDTTAPSVSDQSPAPGSLTNNNMALISANLTDANSGLKPDSIKLSVDGASLNFNYQSGVLSAKPGSPLANGRRTIRIQAQDFAGNALDTSWGFMVDADKPTGSILINGGDETTSYARVRLNLEAKDQTTQATEMIISNDGVFDTEKWEAFKPLRTDWILDTPQKVGKKTVYCMFKDEAGNISSAYKASINLITPAIDTIITLGPYSPTKDTNANFVYQATMDKAVFSYKLDDADWSDWLPATSVSFSNLLPGNHMFSAKAAKDLNNDKIISQDEEDPIPAQWTWVITSLVPEKAKEEKVLYWRTE